MRNFNYIKDLGLNDLYRFCSAAEENQWSNPDFSAINARKALEYMEKQKAAINQSIVETQKLFDYTMDKYFG